MFVRYNINDKTSMAVMRENIVLAEQTKEQPLCFRSAEAKTKWVSFVVV